MKKFLGLFLMIPLLSLNACSFFKEKETTDSNNSSFSTVNSTMISSEATHPSSSVISEESQPSIPMQTVVTLYFPNQKYIESGQAEANFYLTEERAVVSDKDHIAQVVVEELLKGPLNTPSAGTGIPTSVQLNQVKVIEPTAYVDLKRQGLNGGSLQEYFLINQIVKSLLALDSVEVVQFLVDGEITESLMGHYEVTQPFTSEIN